MAEQGRSSLEQLEQRAMPAPEDGGWWANVRRLLVRTAVDSIEDRVPGMAAEMAFYVVLSLPPLLLAILGSVGFIVGGLPTEDLARLEAEILAAARTFLTEQTVNDVLREPIQSLLREGRSDVLSLGIVLTLWSASRATNVLLRTVTVAYDLSDTRPAWKRRLLALAITVAGIVLATLVIPLLVIGPRVAAALVDAAGLDPSLSRLWNAAYWGGVGVVALVALTWLYHVAPGWFTPWRRDLPGAVVALGIWLAAGWGLREYTAQFLGVAADDAFSGLAAPLVLLLWVYMSAIAVLVGAELNAEVERLWPSEEGPYEEPQPRV